MNRDARWRHLILVGVTTAFLVACGDSEGGGDTSIPPGPEDPDAFVASDSARIMADLQLLSHDSLEGRRTGEPGNVLARA